MAWPPFIFRVEEFGPSARAPRPHASRGWWPPGRLGDNVIRGGPTHHKLYCCNGQIIRPVHEQALGNSREFHAAWSIYHYQHQISVVDCDATDCVVGDANSRGRRDPNAWVGWQRLRFLSQPNGVSLADIAGDQDRLDVQHPYQVWAHRLFPPDYQALRVGGHHPGGLCGPLPLLLALIVLAHPPQQSEWALTQLFQDGRWNLQNIQTFRQDLRGVMVKVWAWHPNSNRYVLEHAANGHRGPLF